MISRFVQDNRKRQVDTLKIFNDNVIEITENEEYSLGFESGGHQFTLNVFLGKHFPNEKPRFIIKPSINHHWINAQNGEIESAPGLLNFTIHSDLGRVAQAVIREIEKHPPILEQYSNNSKTSMMANQSQNDNNNIQMTNLPKNTISNQTNTKNNNSNSNSMTVENIQFTNLLQQLNIGELHNLNNDIDYLDEYVDNLEPIKKLNNELLGLLDEVNTIAETNLSYKTVIEQRKNKLNENIEIFKKLGENYNQLSKRYQRKSEEFEPQHIKELLQIAGSTADLQCDEYVQQFLNGKINSQQFLNLYLEAKRISAMRKAKEERLTYQLNELEKAGTF